MVARVTAGRVYDSRQLQADCQEPEFVIKYGLPLPIPFAPNTRIHTLYSATCIGNDHISQCVRRCGPKSARFRSTRNIIRRRYDVSVIFLCRDRTAGNLLTYLIRYAVVCGQSYELVFRIYSSTSIDRFSQSYHRIIRLILSLSVHYQAWLQRSAVQRDEKIMKCMLRLQRNIQTFEYSSICSI